MCFARFEGPRDRESRPCQKESLADSPPNSAGAEVARLRKCHVWCLRNNIISAHVQVCRLCWLFGCSCFVSGICCCVCVCVVQPPRNKILYDTILYYTILHYITYHIMLYYIILFISYHAVTILYYTIIYYTLLYYTII